MEPTVAILVTLIVYEAILLAIGFLAGRRTHDTADFFLGGRRLGPWVAAISASASSSSAWTLLGVSGAAYAWGVGAAWLLPACAGGFVVNWYVLAPRLREASHRTGALTLTELLAGPPGAKGRRAVNVVASLIVVFSLTAYVASQFQGAGKAFAETFELDETTSVLIGAGVVIVYTMVGGFWAASVTDTLQGLVMAASCVLLPVAALGAVGGPAELFRGLREVARVEPGFTDPLRGLGGVAGAGFVLGVLGIGVGYPGQPHVVNRLMALRDERALRRGRRIAVAWAVVVYAGMIVLGWCGRVLFGGLEDREDLLVHAASALLHPVLGGVLVAAVLSAIMSTADSQLLVAASAVTHDLANERGRSALGRSRAVVVGLSVVAVVFAIYATESIFRNVLFAWTAMGAAFGPPLLVTVWRGRPPGGRVVGAIVAGFSLAVGFYWLQSAPESYSLLGAWPRVEALARDTAAVQERILPFVASFTISAWPVRRDREGE